MTSFAITKIKNKMSEHTINEPSEEFVNDIKELARVLIETYASAEKVYAPEVERLIRSKCIDQREIEQMLDYLLGCANYDPILVLFKRLCRYYYTLNPEAVASYVNIYREMWEENEDETK
jgi:hypothetical protein